MKRAIGYISYSHGLDGKVKIVPMVDIEQFKEIIYNKEPIFYINENNNTENIHLDIVAFNGKVFICKIIGISSIEEAKKILKKEIYTDIEDNDFIDAESLIGFDVLSYYHKTIIGKVVDCGDYGSGMLIEIELLNNKYNNIKNKKQKKPKNEFYLCNKEIIKNIDTKNKQIVIKNYNN